MIKGTSGTGLEGNRCIGSLFDGRLGSPSSPVFDIPLALPSGFGTTGAVRGLEIALGYSLFSGVALGFVKRVGIGLLTRILRLLQVVQPLEVPGMPPMLDWRA